MSSTLKLSVLALAAMIALPGLAQAQAPAAAAVASAKAVVAQGDLVDTLKLSGQFTMLVKGIDATNLAGLLKTNKNLTVFAPTDAAFALVPAEDLAKLMADKVALQKFVLHHVVNAPIQTSRIKGTKGPVPSGSGEPMLLDGSDPGGALKVDGATIIQADLQTASGLLHIVDHVLISGQGAVDPPAEAPAAPAVPAPKP